MPKLAANLSMLFREHAFPDRFAAAARAGFRAVEFQFPYEWHETALSRAARDADLLVVLHNLPAGDTASGELGIACLPGREQEFRDGVERALRYARAFDCSRLNCLAGIAPAGIERDRLAETLANNLRFAARRLAAEGIELMVEPVNTRTVPGFFLSGSRDALAIIDAAGEPNIRLQYDIFHMQVMEGDLSSRIEALLPRIGHMQLADSPGRNEPGTGEINFSNLLAHIDRVGYEGWVGCEYHPARDTLSSLGWARPYL
jgi:hydroxypyruvate isomerase